MARLEALRDALARDDLITARTLAIVAWASSSMSRIC
jgi:hypothetical protein